MKPSLLFIGKAEDDHCAALLDFAREKFGKIHARLGGWRDPFPNDLKQWHGDYVVSYLSRWILPDQILKSAACAAINFHPAPPSYPGVGCVNFALYEGASQYGVTCHHMAAKVDTGPIIAVRRFDILPSDDVSSLLKRTHDKLLNLGFEILKLLSRNDALPLANEQWTRTPLRRTNLDALSQVRPDMDDKEIRRRVRATSFGKFQPFVELGGYRFEYCPPNEKLKL